MAKNWKGWAFQLIRLAATAAAFCLLYKSRWPNDLLNFGFCTAVAMLAWGKVRESLLNAAIVLAVTAVAWLLGDHFKYLPVYAGLIAAFVCIFVLPWCLMRGARPRSPSSPQTISLENQPPSSKAHA